MQEKYGRDLEIHISQEASRELLSENEFWELITLLDWSQEEDDEAVIEPLVRRLSEMPVPFIYQFQNKLAEKLYYLDTQAHAEQSGENAYSPDEPFSVGIFLYQRCCVVANGRELYEEVVRHPKAMPQDLTFEALLHVAGDAYQRKTGKEMAYLPSYNYETFSNKEEWKTA